MYIALRDPEAARLMKARSRLGSRAPGYAAIVFGMPIIETHRTQTLATDGKSFFFNRAYVQSIIDDELMFGWFHEGGHKILCHHLRRPSWCDARTWNIACDHPVNILASKARLKLPEGVLCDWQYDGMTAEQIARLLVKEQKAQPQQPPQPPQGGDEGEGEGQGGSGADDDTDDDDQDQDDDGQGQGGDDADDGQGDASEQFASEIDSIREMIKPDRTCVIYCDDFIQKGRDGQTHDVFDSYEDIEVRAISGGGTRFDPPFHLVDQEGLEPHAFVYFTDGYATVREGTADIVDYPVLWATTGKEPTFQGQEFGEVVKLTM